MNRTQKLLDVAGDDIRQDCEDYQRLRTLMQSLYDRLLKRDSEQIEVLNSQIAALTDGVRARAERRSKILAAFRLEANRDGMQRLIAGSGEQRRDALQLTWTRLGELAAECKQLNERNGKLLAMHQDLLHQLLASPNAGSLYEPQAF